MEQFSLNVLWEEKPFLLATAQKIPWRGYVGLDKRQVNFHINFTCVNVTFRKRTWYGMRKTVYA